MKHRQLRAAGITDGIGSLLVGPRDEGFKIIGNIEWRTYYHAKDELGRNTFTENFPGAFLKKKYRDLDLLEIVDMTDLDLIGSHPECGAYSVLGIGNRDRVRDASDIPLAAKLIHKFQPKIFYLDELPGSLAYYSMHDWIKALPDYHLWPEWISNYHYGNVQKFRKRMFMVGARKDIPFVFIPNEKPTHLVLWDAIGEDLMGLSNMEPHALDEECTFSRHVKRRGWSCDWRDLHKIMPPGKRLFYYTENGRVASRIGFDRGKWDKFSNLLNGSLSLTHPDTGYPLTIRERARIQGFPDDFTFYGTKLRKDGTWSFTQNQAVVKQTGKAMPVQFGRHMARLAKHWLIGSPLDATDKRALAPQPQVTIAKETFCKEVGYGDLQEEACRHCWHTKDCPMAKVRNYNWKLPERKREGYRYDD